MSKCAPGWAWASPVDFAPGAASGICTPAAWPRSVKGCEPQDAWDLGSPGALGASPWERDEGSQAPDGWWAERFSGDDSADKGMGSS